MPTQMQNALLLGPVSGRKQCPWAHRVKFKYQFKCRMLLFVDCLIDGLLRASDRSFASIEWVVNPDRSPVFGAFWAQPACPTDSFPASILTANGSGSVLLWILTLVSTRLKGSEPSLHDAGCRVSQPPADADALNLPEMSVQMLGRATSPLGVRLVSVVLCKDKNLVVAGDLKGSVIAWKMDHLKVDDGYIMQGNCGIVCTSVSKDTGVCIKLLQYQSA